LFIFLNYATKINAWYDKGMSGVCCGVMEIYKEKNSKIICSEFFEFIISFQNLLRAAIKKAVVAYNRNNNGRVNTSRYINYFFSSNFNSAPSTQLTDTPAGTVTGVLH